MAIERRGIAPDLRLRALESEAQRIAGKMKELMPEGVCFFLLMSYAGTDQPATYIANMPRADGIKVMQELIEKWSDG